MQLNTVKHPLLKLSVHHSDHVIEFIISDNGKGFDIATVKKGNGLMNMQKRADEMVQTYLCNLYVARHYLFIANAKSPDEVLLLKVFLQIFEICHGYTSSIYLRIIN